MSSPEPIHVDDRHDRGRFRHYEIKQGDEFVVVGVYAEGDSYELRRFDDEVEATNYVARRMRHRARRRPENTNV
jgi:hypothetical protein